MRSTAPGDSSTRSPRATATTSATSSCSPTRTGIGAEATSVDDGAATDQGAGVAPASRAERGRLLQECVRLRECGGRSERAEDLASPAKRSGSLDWPVQPDQTSALPQERKCLLRH